MMHSVIWTPKQLATLKAEENPLGFLQNEIRVDFSKNLGEIIRVQMKGDNREETIQIVQAVVDSYIDEVATNDRGEMSRKLETLRDMERKHNLDLKERLEKVNKLAKELGTADSELAEINERINMERYRNAVNKADMLLNEAEELNMELFVMQGMAQNGDFQPSEYDINMLLERDPQYYETKAMMDELDENMRYVQSTVRQGPAVNRFASQRAQLQQRMEERRRELTPQIVHVLKRELYKTDEIADSQRLAALQAQMNMTVERWKAAKKEADQQREDIMNMSNYSAELDAEKGNLEALKESIDEVGKEKFRTEMDLRASSRIELVNPAIIPADDSFLMKLVQMGGAWLMTFFGTVLGITGWDYLSKRVNVPRDVEKKVGMPVIGSLPTVRGRTSLAGAKASAITDSIDSIRAAISYGRSGTNSVVVTSAIGQEGKSTVASQLAVSLARSGLKTVLIDGDVRKPTQHAVFGLPPDRGICDVLRGQAELQSVVQATPAENLWILPAGRCDQVAFQALSAAPLSAIMQELKDQFDFIVVDGSPVLTGPEALIFGQFVDGAVVSTRRDVSQLEKVEEAYSRLKSVGIPVIGAVVNGIVSETRNRLVAMAAS